MEYFLKTRCFYFAVKSAMSIGKNPKPHVDNPRSQNSLLKEILCSIRQKISYLTSDNFTLQPNLLHGWGLAIRRLHICWCPIFSFQLLLKNCKYQSPVLIGNVKEIIAQSTQNQDGYMRMFDNISQYMFRYPVSISYPDIYGLIFFMLSFYHYKVTQTYVPERFPCSKRRHIIFRYSTFLNVPSICTISTHKSGCGCLP